MPKKKTRCWLRAGVCGEECHAYSPSNGGACGVFVRLTDVAHGISRIANALERLEDKLEPAVPGSMAPPPVVT